MVNTITKDIHTGATVEMPLMKGAQLEIVQAYYRQGDADRGSARNVWQLLDKMSNEIKDLGDTGQFSTTSTVSRLRMDHRNGFVMFRLMMAIPRKMMASLLRQTVAYDLFGKRAPIQMTAGPGIYVVTVSVKGRAGMFLNRFELQQLIQFIRQYERFGLCLNRIVHDRQPGLDVDVKNVSSNLIRKHCADAFAGSDSDSDSDSTMGDDQVSEASAAFALIGRMDYNASNGNHKTAEDGCLFVKPLAEETGCERLAQLASMLARRLGGYSEDDELDPDDTDHGILQVQAPMYVGCANQLEERVKIYKADKDLRAMNKPMAVLVSAMVELGVQPDLKARVVIRTWEDDQLPYAEVLVMTLARSLIWQDGTNRTQGGANAGKSLGSKTEPSKAFVMSLTSHLHESLELEEDLLPKRLQYVQDVQGMLGSVEALERDATSLENDLQNHEGRAGLAADIGVLQILKNAAQTQDQKLEELRQKRKVVDLALKLAKLVVADSRESTASASSPAPGEDADDGTDG